MAISAAGSLGELVAGRGRRVPLRVGQVLFHEGDPSDAVYACTQGRVNVFITTPTGRHVMLGAKLPGQVFGELSALDGGRRSATAIAKEPTTVAVMQAAEFLEEFEHAPQLSFQLLCELAAHLRGANARASARASDNVDERVADLLLELGEKFRRHAAACEVIVLPVTQDELAAWVGSTREAVARSLGNLRRQGAVTTGRNRIVLSDVGVLNALVQSRAPG